MTLKQFVEKWRGKHVDVDGVYPDQCMDLMHQYLMDVLGLSRHSLAKPAAYQVYTEFDTATDHDRFERIKNTPEGVPHPGDVVIMGQSLGRYGHVCVFLEGNVDSFTSFDANYPLGTLPHEQKHNYQHVLGWLRYKGGESMNCSECKYEATDPDGDKSKTETGGWYAHEWETEKGIRLNLEEREKILLEENAQLKNKNNEWEEKYNGQIDQIKTLQETNENLKDTNTRLSKEAVSHTEEIKILKTEVSSLKTSLGASESNLHVCRASLKQVKGTVEDQKKYIERLESGNVCTLSMWLRKFFGRW